MAGFLYFFPDKQMLNSKEVDKLPDDLKPVLHDCGWDYGFVDKGPEGAGALIAPHTKDGKQAACIYNAQQQSWFCAGDYWIGFSKDHPPTPQDLRRTTTTNGNSVTVDKNTWVVPIVQAMHTTLPMGISYQHGAAALIVEPQYQSLLETAAEMWDYRMLGKEIGDDPQAELNKMYFYCCDLLQINYRLGRAECSMGVLNLVRSTNFVEFVDASLGLPQITQQREALKKKIDTPDDT